MNEFQTIVAVTVLFTLFLVLVRWGHCLFYAKPENTRAILHMVGGVVFSFSPFLLSREAIIVLGIIFAIIIFFSKHFKFVEGIHGVERITWGEVLYPLGIALAAFLFLPHDLLAFQFGVLVLGISDAVAALVGRNFGTLKFIVFQNKKTLEGSVAFFISVVVLMILFSPGAPALSFFIIPFVLTLAEFILVYGFDDLLLPIAAGTLLQLIG